MLHPLGLILSIAVGLALAFDLLGHRGRRRAMAPFGWMAVVVAFWAGGELLLLAANTPGEVIAARRLLFLGPCAFPALWLWAAWSVRGRPLGRARLAALAVTAALEAFAYSFLWWDESGRFLDWYARPPERGPVFLVHAAVAWTGVAVGFATWTLFAVRESSAHWFPRVVAVGAGVAPFAANAVYVLGGMPGFDPTPMVLIAVGLCFRFVVLGGTFAPYFVSFARAELLDQIDAGILVADVAGRVVEANGAARRLLDSPHIEGQPLETLISRARSRAGEALVARVFELRRRGAIAGHGAVLLERGDERLREQDLEMGRRLAGLGFLAAGIAHEIGRPLRALLGDLDAIEAAVQELARAPQRNGAIELHRRAPARDGADAIEDARQRLERIGETMSLLSSLENRQHGGEPRLVALMEPAAQAVDLARLGQAGRVQIVLRGELPPVWAVRDNVVEILLQLLTNALETDPGSVVQLRLSAGDGGAIAEVLDHGPGIPAAELDHLFDPFFTTKSPDRRGLGLSFAHELARRHGGRLTAGNRPDGGAWFRLWLPTAPPEAS